MRTTATLTLSLVLLIGSNVFAQLPTNQLEGTWRMVSQELVYPDTVINRSDAWGPGYKILNSTHFAWGRATASGDDVVAGGGRYEYDPETGTYTEIIEYHSTPELVGLAIEFEAKVDGDTWYHIGHIGDYRLEEVWHRVRPDELEKLDLQAGQQGER